MSRHNIPTGMAPHSDIKATLAMIPTIRNQEQDFVSWQRKLRKLPRNLADILDLIKTHGKCLELALTALQEAYQDLCRHCRQPDPVIGALERKLNINLFEEVGGASKVYVALGKIASKLDIGIESGRGSGFNWAKILQAPEREAAASFRKYCNQLSGHMGLIRVIARELRHTSSSFAPARGKKTQAQDIVSHNFSKEYDGLERKHLREVSEGLRLRFNEAPFAVTVPLGPGRGQSEEEGSDHADVIFSYLDKENGVEDFLQQFENMGSKWAAGMLGNSTTPEMRTLEIAHTELSCGVIRALQQSVSCDEGVSPLQDDTKFLNCRLERWEELTSHQKIIIAIGGHFSHGKSSFLNALMGEDVLPTNSE